MISATEVSLNLRRTAPTNKQKPCKLNTRISTATGSRKMVHNCTTGPDSARQAQGRGCARRVGNVEALATPRLEDARQVGNSVYSGQRCVACPPGVGGALATRRRRRWRGSSAGGKATQVSASSPSPAPATATGAEAGGGPSELRGARCHGFCASLVQLRTATPAKETRRSWGTDKNRKLHTARQGVIVPNEDVRATVRLPYRPACKGAKE